MGKDKKGAFHPPKGKPSESFKEDISLPDGVEDAHIMHPNRNVNKDEGDYVERSRMTGYKSSTRQRSQAPEEEINVQAEEIGVLNMDVFKQLAGHTSDVCISIYLPTHKAGVEVNERQDLIAFKNALQDIANDLKSKNVDELEINRLLNPANELIRNTRFWTELSDGIAVFISEGLFQYIKMPASSQSSVHTGTSFQLTPLMPFLSKPEHFFMLVLSKKQATLYRADAFGMERLDIPEIPNGVDDVVHFEEKEGRHLFRTGGKGGTGSANFHGMGSGQPDEKTHIAMYFREVDKTIREEVLHTEHAPLLLAGVEYLIPIYKEVTAYHPIWPEPITGNHEHDSYDTLYAMAKEKMAPYFMEHAKKAVEEYGNNSATGLTSPIPDDVIKAAYEGRIARLFVERDAHIWGRVSEDGLELEIHPERMEEDSCLVNKAAIKTLLTGGEVITLEKEQMPAESPVAALMRY